MVTSSPSTRPSPTHVPSFKCPSCEAVFLDTIDSLLNHFESVHNGREHLYSKLSPLTLERIFAIVHNSFVSSCRLPYSTSSTSGESSDFPFPAEQNRWKEWFVSSMKSLRCPFTDGLVLPTHNNNHGKHDDSPPPLGTASVIKTTPIEPADVPSTPLNESGEVNGNKEELPLSSLLPTLEVRAARQKRLLSVAMKRSGVTGAQLLGRTCPICRRVFENRCKLTLHQMEHKKELNPYKCPVRGCLSEYPDYRQLRVHLITGHNGVMGAAVQTSQPISPSVPPSIVKEEVMDE
ncbi:hypothetical protein PRIPAC_73606 [Pristionchus pacificus]|nr:hypothetical protein PRIPAC_73606 [Pristionchus pacificus]